MRKLFDRDSVRPPRKVLHGIGGVIPQVDKINRQVAARMVSSSAFTAWKDYDVERQHMMKEQLARILAENGLSENVFEVASKSLEAA